MRSIFLYQYDETEGFIKLDGKFVINRTTLTYDQKPDEDVTYAVSTTLPKQQLVVAPVPGKVYEVSNGLYRVWLDGIDDYAVMKAIDDYISSKPKPAEEVEE